MVKKNSAKFSKKFNISNRLSYTIIAVIALIFLAVGVSSYLFPGVTPNPGHLISETAPPSGCGDGQFLKWVTDEMNIPAGSWTCASVVTSSGITTPSPCTTGQVLTYSGSTWNCATPASGGTTITNSLSFTPVNTGVAGYALYYPVNIS
mgnify:CR=1 FL=1